jgi:2-methylcitrate dehydratase PrpD
LPVRPRSFDSSGVSAALRVLRERREIHRCGNLAYHCDPLQRGRKKNMTIATELARKITATTFDDLGPQALHYARMGLLDTLGVGIAGSQEDAAAIARKITDEAAGPATVWGTNRRAGAPEAAFLNGIAANVLDFDDCTDNLGGHPSAPVLPALLALAEKLRAGGRAVLTAYVAGFETETQLGRGVNFHHYEKGWHPTATLGVFGAGAACARLLELDAGRTTHALALCASMAAGLKSNLGSMAKPLHIGQASRNGLLAALLAAEGYTANADAIEHAQGFLEVFNGRGNYDSERILAKWGQPWDIEMPGISIKQYPCCLSMQGTADLMLKLVGDHDIQPGDVTQVRARIAARRLAHTNRPQPKSALDAKLSMHYVLARALVNRSVSLEHFDGDTYKAPEVQRAMKLVDAAPFDAGSTTPEFGAEITLVTRDGREVSGTIERPVGHSPGKPLAHDKLAAKFSACARRVLDAQQIGDILAKVADCENLADIRALTVLLAPSRETSRVAAAG